MDCPNCGTPEKARIRKCGNCSHEYSSKDLTEFRQLEFLVNETADWKVAKKLRLPYINKLNALRERILPSKHVEEQKKEKILVKATVTPTIVKAPTKAKPLKPKPQKEKVPFDQWLLSERNIKFALYVGAGLLVLAGIIFVGLRWTSMSGGWKFIVTLLTTGTMYAGGYMLFHKPAFRLGGNALLGIASGFFALNFAVLQIYVFGPTGFPDDVMWLIASPICMLLYMYTAYLTKSELFTYFSIAAYASTLMFGLAVNDANQAAWILTFILAIFSLQLMIAPLGKSVHKEYTVKHLDLVSMIGMPLGLLISFGYWADITGCVNCAGEYPWVVIAAFAIGTSFFTYIDIVKNNRFARWIWSALFVVLMSMIFAELEFNKTLMGISMMLVSVAYLVAGFWIEQSNTDEKNAGAAFYWLAYIVAGLVTLESLAVVGDLANVLLADVALLALTAYFRKEYRWVYAATWLFMLPYYIYLSVVFEVQHVNQGLLMGLLGLIYSGTGYLLGQKEIKHSGPFLTAAALLSFVVVIMTLQYDGVLTIVLLTTASLYTLAALWLDKKLLLLVGLGALSMAIIPLNLYLELDTQEQTFKSMLILFGILGSLAAFGGVTLRQSEHKRWGWPLYITALVDLGGAYLISLIIGFDKPDGWYAISFSIITASFLLYIAWKERKLYKNMALSAILSFIGMTVIAIGHFYLLNELIQRTDTWPLYSALFAGIYISAAWFIKGEDAEKIYAVPMRWTGMAVGIIPLLAALVMGSNLQSAFIYFVAAALYFTEAGLRKLVLAAYAGASLLIISYNYLLAELLVDNDNWPLFMVIFASVYVASSWFLRNEKRAQIYAEPLRWTGMAFMVVALLAASAKGDAMISAVVFGVASAVMLTEAGVRKTSLFTYVGSVLLFISYNFFLQDLLPNNDSWPIMLALFSSGLVLLALFLESGEHKQLFAIPFRLFGIYLLIIPLMGALSISGSVISTTTFAISATILLIDAWSHNHINQIYLSVAVYIAALWSLLGYFDVTETQAYAIPLGLALVIAGWYEREYRQGRFYLVFTVFGLIIMLGSAFIQSLPVGEEIYVWLLALESIVALWWGIKTKSRGYVQLGGIALAVNAFLQFAPGFAELPRWVQLGTFGSFLLGLGMLALFKREEMLIARRKLTKEWKSWNA